MLSRICGLSQKTAHFARIIQFTPKNGLSLSSSIFSQQSNYATTERKSNGSKTKSLQVLIEDLKSRVENKTRLTKYDLQSVLAKLASQKANAEQAFEILRCCSFARLDENQNAVVKKIWNALKSQGEQFQIQHYNRILTFARDRADVKLAEEILNEIGKNEIKPDAGTYQLLLGTYCKAGEMEKAVGILALMDKEEMHINEKSYNYLVQCNIICGNLDAANETMANLKSAGFKPNMFTFDEFLRHYAKTGDLDGVEQTISRMKEENIELMNRDILKVIREVAANGHAEQVDSLLELIKPTIELRQSLRNAIEIFVDKRLSPIVPKILERAGGDVNEKVKHLIEKMVRSSTPEAEFKATIGAIEAMGITIESNFDLFKPALDGPSADIIRRLLNHMQEKSIPATENVFEKLFRLAAEKDANEVLGVVNLMSKEFKIQPQVTFVRDVILPGLKCKESPALALAKLQGTSIRPRIALLAIVTDCLIKKNIKMAYEFANTNFRAFYGIDLVRRPLLEAFAATGDIENFVLFVRHVHDSFKELNNYHNSTTDQNATPLTETQIQTKQKAYIEELLWAAIANRRNEAQLVTQLLKSFATEGLTISPAQAEKLQKYLQVEGDTEIGRLLTKLSTESLPLRPIEVKRYQPSAMNKLSSNEIQNILEVKLAQGHSAAATEKMLFLAYVREGNAAEIESILAKDKISLSNSDYAQLIDLYTRHNNLENALNILKRVCANNSSFKLDPIKVAKLVRLMIDKERNFDEIDALLLAHRQGKAEHRIFIFEHLLDQLAENGCFKLIEQLFDSLIEYQYIEPTPQSTGPLIKAYCVKGKYTEAVTKFEHFASTHKLVPMTMVLFVQLIKNNQVESLQRAFDAVEQLHGERNALYRLAFAFIECGQDRQARAIFENDRLDNITPAIVRECKTFVKFDRIEPLMVLLKATKGLFCNRHVIYQSLLDVYTKKNNASEALELWCEYLTDDGILPVLRFKKGLISLLKANDMPIPPELTENDKTSENAKPSDETFTKQTILN